MIPTLVNLTGNNPICNGDVDASEARTDWGIAEGEEWCEKANEVEARPWQEGCRAQHPALPPHSERRISVGSVRSARSTAGSVATNAASRRASVGQAIIFASVALT